MNLYAFSGRMEGWRTPKLLRALNNTAARFAYRVPVVTEAAATAYLVFSANPAVGDTVVVGEYTYTFQSALSLPNDVLLGATAMATANNLVAAVTNDAGQQSNEGVLYGTNTAQNQQINPLQTQVSQYPLGAGSGSAAYIPVIVFVAVTYGVSFNGTPVVKNSTALTFISNPLSLASVTTTMTGGANPSFNNNITQAGANWLEFLDQDTDVVRSQVLNDFYQRFYMASPSQQPQYNTLARIQAGQPAFLLGLNPPTVAPTVTTSGGGDISSQPAADVVASSATATFSGNTMYLFPFVPTGDCTVNDVTLFSPTGFGVANMAGVVYADAGSGVGPNSWTVPSVLLGTGTVANSEISTFLNPVDLVANTPYWIGMMTDTTFTVAKGASGLSHTVSYVNTFTLGPAGVLTPSVIVTGQPNLNMYATLQSDSVVEARAYVYTWVSAYQEESAPSPFTIATGWTDGTWEVQLSQPPPGDMGTLRNIQYVNVYRTVSGASGATVYYWIGQFPIAQTTVYDTTTDDIVVQHIQLPSTNYFPPPPNLQGMINLPNGMVAGFIGNQIWICQPFLPHAWPPANVFTTDFPIVGLGLTLGTLVAATQANSFILSGSTPATMSISKCAPPDPCISRRSILSTDTGVFYMSPHGLIQVSNIGQSTNTTELWITREKWAALVPQKYSRGDSPCRVLFLLRQHVAGWCFTDRQQRSAARFLHRDGHR